MPQLELTYPRPDIAVLTLNRPDKLNALNVELFKELDAHVRKLAKETETVGLVVVRGAGRCFSAGHDRLRQRDDGLDQPVVVLTEVISDTEVLEALLLELGEILSGAEPPALARHDDGTDLLLLRARVERIQRLSR